MHCRRGRSGGIKLWFFAFLATRGVARVCATCLMIELSHCEGTQSAQCGGRNCYLVRRGGGGGGGFSRGFSSSSRLVRGASPGSVNE